MKIKMVAFDGDEVMFTTLSSEINLDDEEQIAKAGEEFRQHTMGERANQLGQCARCEEWFLNLYDKNGRNLCHDCEIEESEPLNQQCNE